MILILALIGSTVIVLSQTSSANSAPYGTMIKPEPNQTFSTGGSTHPVSFTTSATDPDNATGLSTQVMYRKVGESRWISYGTAVAQDPAGNLNSIPNGVTGQYLNQWGWSCQMGFGATPPANCGSWWTNGRVSGPSAYSGYSIYHPSVNLTPGIYEWTVRSKDSSYAYGAWPTPRRFTIAYVPPPPTAPPTPTPTPTTTPTPTSTTPPVTTTTPAAPTSTQKSAPTTKTVPKTTTSKNTNNTISAPTVTEDKEPPSTPVNVFGNFDPTNNSINLTWSSSSDNNAVVGYEIERVEKGGTKWEIVGETEETNFEDFTFEPKKTYQYRVRSMDQSNNYSDYSTAVDVVAGEFTPNVTVKDGGIAQDGDGMVILEFPAEAVSEDIFVSIEKTGSDKVNIKGNNKLVGNVYEIRAKNSKGVEINKFNKQISIIFNYTTGYLKGVNKKTLRISTTKDDKVVTTKTLNDFTKNESKTLTDHLSLYFLTAEKTSPWLTFFKILFWIFFIILIGVGGYYGYQYYMRRKYQQEHREDFIYKH